MVPLGPVVALPAWPPAAHAHSLVGAPFGSQRPCRFGREKNRGGGVKRSWWCIFVLLWGVGVVAHADMVQATARVKPSVVVVGTFKATDSPRFQLRGTGFVVGDGTLAVTNVHVLPEVVGVEEAPALAVLVRSALGEWQQRLARVVASEPARDLAVLRFEGLPAPALVVGDSGRVQEGQSLGFVGFPIGGALGYTPVTHRARSEEHTSELQ